MPPIIRLITYANPTRYFMVTIRGIFLKGVRITVRWPHLVALAIIGTTLLTVSALRSRKRTE